MSAAAAAVTDLATVVAETPLVDTHEHLQSERQWVEDGPDVLQDLFYPYYMSSDLLVAGATPAAVERVLDASAGSIESRFAGVREAWEAMRHTGYGAATLILARQVYGIEELTPAELERAQARLEELRRPGERVRLLRDVAGLDHVQIDHVEWAPRPEQDPDFFLYDISWWRFCNGEILPEEIEAATGIEVRGLEDLREAMATIFARNAAAAIAVKSQHAYNRTLRWRERSDEEAASALTEVLRNSEQVDILTRFFRADLSGGGVTEEARLVLGDWCLARGVELAIEHDLPFKIHTGYYAANGPMPVERIRPGNLAGLIDRYREARFVLMHIAYPYGDELVAIAKHFPNVWVDLCWAWSVDPYGAGEFVRRFLHAVPANKLFAFGGDVDWPTTAVAFAAQARHWLRRTLEAEVADGDLTEAEAIEVAGCLMRENQRACFAIEATRVAAHAEAIEENGGT